uniref:G-protein coupled receptors family 1 profile domain-containing protein n=1 Tax=Strongyloides stercoralis TaxID=6248 RepID=A0A0K0E1C5_STRER
MVSIIGNIRCIVAYFSSFIPMSPTVNGIFVPYQPSYAYGILHFSFYYTTYAHYVSIIMLLLHFYQLFDKGKTTISNNIYYEFFTSLVVPIPATICILPMKSHFQLTHICSIKQQLNYMVLVISAKNMIANALPKVIVFCYALYILYSLIFIIIVIIRYIKIRNKNNNKNNITKMMIAILYAIFQYPYFAVKCFQYTLDIDYTSTYIYAMVYLSISTFIATSFLILIVIIVDKNSRRLFY